jgi:hypothetical protein
LPPAPLLVLAHAREHAVAEIANSHKKLRHFSIGDDDRTPGDARRTSVPGALRVAPQGTRRVARNLGIGGAALAEAGRLGIFTPMYFLLARKPA